MYLVESLNGLASSMHSPTSAPLQRQRGGSNIRAKFEIEGVINSRPQGHAKLKRKQDQDERQQTSAASGFTQ